MHLPVLGFMPVSPILQVVRNKPIGKSEKGAWTLKRICGSSKQLLILLSFQVIIFMVFVPIIRSDSLATQIDLDNTDYFHGNFDRLKASESPARDINKFPRDIKPKSELKFRPVPVNVSRFDFPWIIYPRVRMLSLRESNYRVLYSSVRTEGGAGLGHDMAMINTEVSTALRLNLTYTHRTSRYGYLSMPRSVSESGMKRLEVFSHAAAVEELFGWGVGEIPREHIEKAVCGKSTLDSNLQKCPICRLFDPSSSIKVTNPNQSYGLADPRRFYIKHIAELPEWISYKYPAVPSESSRERLRNFVNDHPNPYSLFVMPTELCKKNEAHAVTTLQERSFYYNKYWDAHGHKVTNNVRHVSRQESFQDYRQRLLTNFRIEPFLPRPKLWRLPENMINIAVHARRGDFFTVKRPMISVEVISRVIRAIISHVCYREPSVFSSIGVSVAIYSEGRKKNSGGMSRSHNVNEMTHEFLDTDQTVLGEKEIRKKLTDSTDNLGAVFKNGLRIMLSISECTVLSIHEMASADIFIGSESGLSSHVIGSLSRAAFLLMPSFRSHETGRFILFNSSTGSISEKNFEAMRGLWNIYVANHAENMQYHHYE